MTTTPATRISMSSVNTIGEAFDEDALYE